MSLALPRRSLGDALAGHQNSLGLIRLILASVVIVDHAFPLGGFGKDPFWALTNGQASLGSIAVSGFFAISGYLIAKSGLHGDVIQFLWKRTLRIFPAYWLVLIVTAFIIGPWLWVLGGETLQAYFAGSAEGPTPYFYISGNWTLQIGTYGIYDILATTTPYGVEVGASAFNGSLWTLIYEWRSYLIIAGLVAFGILKRSRIIVAFLALYFFMLQILIGINHGYEQSLVPSFLGDFYMVTLGFTFLLGAVVAVYSDEVPFDNWIGAFAAVLMLATLRYGGFSTVGTIAGVYFVLYLAARLPKKVQWIGQKNDYSYGMYIYGFLVQQVLAYFGAYKLGLLPYISIALGVTFVCAWLSWHLLEKWMMKLKDFGPGKGVRFWWETATRKLQVSRN